MPPGYPFQVQEKFAPPKLILYISVTPPSFIPPIPLLFLFPPYFSPPFSLLFLFSHPPFPLFSHPLFPHPFPLPSPSFLPPFSPLSPSLAGTEGTCLQSSQVLYIPAQCKLHGNGGGAPVVPEPNAAARGVSLPVPCR